MPIDVARIVAHEWRQGSIFTLDVSRPLIRAQREIYGADSFTVSDDARLIVVSHSCDVVHEGDLEPRIEVCPATLIDVLDGNYTGTRNSRRLQIELEITGMARPCELWASTRFFLARSELERSVPDPAARILVRHERHLQHWLAKRFTRAALPTNFNERIGRDTQRRIGRKMRPLHADIYSLLIAVNPKAQDLPPGQPYAVQVVALMTSADYQDAEKLERVTIAMADVEAIMDQRPDIDFEGCFVEPMSSFTLEDHRGFVIWDCDDASLEADHDAPAPAP